MSSKWLKWECFELHSLYYTGAHLVLNYRWFQPSSNFTVKTRCFSLNFETKFTVWTLCSTPHLQFTVKEHFYKTRWKCFTFKTWRSLWNLKRNRYVCIKLEKKLVVCYTAKRCVGGSNNLIWWINLKYLKQTQIDIRPVLQAGITL